jgi:hypothetical protein
VDNDDEIDNDAPIDLQAHPRRHHYTRGDATIFLKNLRAGCSFNGAALAAGCSASGLRERMKRDARFARAVENARGRPRSVVENAVYLAAVTPDKHGRRDINAAKLWLQTQAPDGWRDEHTPIDTVDREVRDRAARLSDETRATLRARAKARAFGEVDPEPGDEPIH